MSELQKKQENLKIDHKLFNDLLDEIETQIRRTGIQYDFIVPIPRGGLIPAVYLSHRLDIPIISLDMWSDIVRTHNKNDLKDVVLLVDDVVDTSTTLETHNNIITPYTHVACLVKKPWAKTPPKYYGMESDKWVLFDWERGFYF